MNDLQVKYNSLDADSKKAVLDFIDFLAAKMKTPKKKGTYKKEILSISTWSDDDVKVIEDAGKSIQFNTEQW